LVRDTGVDISNRYIGARLLELAILGLLKEQGKVYWRDNSGDRRYVADENRQSAIADAERRVTAECG